MGCLTPINVKPKKGQEVSGGFSVHSVPCGKCAKCKLRRIQGWVFRLQQESKIHYSAWFITLTYSVPPLSEAGFMTLRRSDLTNFFKRLRYNTGKKSIKYYACGEYGSTSWRPHYHAIIFDVSPEEVLQAWSLDNGKGVFVPIGHCHFGSVTDDSIAYCAKYIAKDVRVPVHANDDRVKEYSVMSKGIGKNYLTPQILDYHNGGTVKRSYLTMRGGATHAMPRYYRDRIFSDSDKQHMNSDISDTYDSKFRASVEYYGSVENYYRARHYSIIAANKAFFKQKRNKQ